MGLGESAIYQYIRAPMDSNKFFYHLKIIDTIAVSGKDDSCAGASGY